MTSNVGFFNGRLGIAKSDPKVSVYINTQDAIKLPAGFTSQRPAGLNVEPGMMRYNTTTGKFEGYSGETGSEAWGSLGDGSGGGGGTSTTSGETGETTLQGQTLDSIDPNMSQLMTNQTTVVGGGDFEVMGSGTDANLDIIAPAGSANLNLKVGTAASAGATIGWNNTVIDFNKKVKINGDLTLTGNLLESDGVTPRVFSNWTVATNPNDIYRGTGYVGIGTTEPGAKLNIKTPGNGTRDAPNNATAKALSIDDGNNGLYLNIGTSSNGTTAAFGLNWYNSGSHTDVDNVLVLKNVDGENRVGIGTTSPGSKLEIYDDSPAGQVKDILHVKNYDGYDMVSLGTSSNFNSGQVTLYKNTATKASENQGVVINANGNSYFNGGNVGIGTTTPYAQLEVTQSVNSKSHIRIGDGNHNGYASPSIYPALTYYARKDAVRRNTDPLFSGVGDAGGCTAAICFTDRPGTYTYASAVRTSDITFYTALNTIDNTVLGYYPRERMRITAEGNVGIGTTSPDEKLHIKGGNLRIERPNTEVPRIELIRNNSSKNFGGDNYQDWAIQNSGGNFELISGHSTNGNTTVLSSDGTNVGIGINNPETYKLYVKHDGTGWSSIFNTTKTQVYLSHKDGYGIAFDSTETTSSTYALNLANGDGSWLRAYNNKQLVIWDGASLKLNQIYGNNGLNYHVSGYGKHGFTGSEHWSGQSPNFVYLAKFNGKIWLTNGYQNTSDERIKSDIQDVPDHESLNKVLAIQVRKYGYKDYYNRGSERTTGFIAQEVLKVFPEAVTTKGDGAIPNIYKFSTGYNYDISENKLTLDISGISLTEDIKIGSKIQLKLMNYETLFEEYIQTILKEINDTNIVVECIEHIKYNIKDKFEKTQKIFIYGSHIDNFHLLDKDKIFTLHHGAIQEIHKEQQADKAKIAELEAKNITLENELKEMKTMLNALKSHLGL